MNLLNFRIKELLVQMQNILQPMSRYDSSLPEEEKDKLDQVLNLICDIKEIIMKDDLKKYFNKTLTVNCLSSLEAIQCTSEAPKARVVNH